ncbi:RNA exonuclease 1 homolog [Nycticebus coucang]|uniref:RNA exonuclease 1 homolog n=1 Tax=Nycticebus coucang TaxID=9470 RepID=UPI00234DD3E9|nr:RNA exonuclease 1 homolog [Nycticebus coucang]
MALRATAPCWFPPGYFAAEDVASKGACPPLWQLSQSGLLPAPQICTQGTGFILCRVEPPRRGPLVAPAYPLTAQEVNYLGVDQAQRNPVSWLQAAPSLAEKPSAVHSSVPGKRRITHVPKPHLAIPLTGAKRTVLIRSTQAFYGQKQGLQLRKTRTLSGAVPKTVTRKPVAPSPSVQSLQKPSIPREGKVPIVIQQSCSKLFTQKSLKFCTFNQEAVEKVLTEEKVAYDRSPRRNIYLNMAVNTPEKLQGLAPSAVPKLNKTSSWRVVSHEVVLEDKLAAKTSFSPSCPGSPSGEDLGQAALYGRLKEHLLTEAQLKENGYPFPHPERPGGAVLFTAPERKPEDPSRQICCRCGSEYVVFAGGGGSVSEHECHYHWGPLLWAGPDRGWQAQYACCSAPAGAVGCQVAKRHVRDGRKERLEGFVTTFRKGLPEDAPPGIYALDCEMSYTTYGLELTRVTVVNTDMQVVYDTFIKPDNEIVDYNTRFSGVTEADVASTSVTLRDVQAVLLRMFSADTILIGHSLESDLLALKVIHSAVVDTAVLFPHRRGLPFKRSLRSLVADYLGRTIQDNANGHNSGEDAYACMQLVMWKARQDAKTRESRQPTSPAAPAHL